jgi:hypothetical protein
MADDPPPDEPPPPVDPTDDLPLAEGSEPEPGYVLVRWRGKGTYGQVWEGKGPGGVPVALKFVRLDEPAGPVELEALELTKEIRNAHLLPVFAYWQRGCWLIIAMELADCSLLDRLQQVVAHGQRGIPAEDLLEYMHEAAKGLDFLNNYHHPSGGSGGVGIQHKDVKPHNLLLVGGTVKVADFGLAQLLETTIGPDRGGLTVAYASPEVLDLRVSRWSDQFSLAVTYCELRSGRRPFAGTPSQVVTAITLKEPDLTMLPEAERPAVARALNKNPRERWPSCREFVKALRGDIPPPPPPPQPWWRRLLAALPMLILALAVSLLSAVATYWLLKTLLPPRTADRGQMGRPHTAHTGRARAGMPVGIGAAWRDQARAAGPSPGTALDRYQGTLMTTTRRRPLKSRYALMTAAVWLCKSRWYQRVVTSSGTITATSRPGWQRCRSVTTSLSGPYSLR